MGKIAFKYDLMCTDKNIYKIICKISSEKLKICYKSLYIYN